MFTPRQQREQHTFNRLVQEKNQEKSLILTALPSFCDYNLDLFRAAMRHMVIPGSRICEIGCGSGEIAVWLARSGAEHVFGVDISDASIALAKQRAISNGTENTTTFIHAPGECTGLPSASLDYVFINVALHHLDLPLALQEIRRILKPQGTLIAIEPLVRSRLAQRVRASRFATAIFPIRQESADERMLTEEDVALLRAQFTPPLARGGVTLTSYRLFSPMLYKIKPLFHTLARGIFWKRNKEQRRRVLNGMAQKLDMFLLYIIPPFRTLGRYSCIVAKNPQKSK